MPTLAKKDTSYLADKIEMQSMLIYTNLQITSPNNVHNTCYHQYHKKISLGWLIIFFGSENKVDPKEHSFLELFAGSPVSNI